MYCIAVKANQPKLFKAIEAHIAQTEALSDFGTQEQNRGRVENRAVSIYQAIDFEKDKGWEGIVQVVSVKRWGKRRLVNKRSKKELKTVSAYETQSYYITDCNFTHARDAYEAVRGHWAIENGLHYVKDTVFNEDRSKISAPNMAINKSTLYNVALNIYRANNFSSIHDAIICYGNKIDKLLLLSENIIL